MCRVQSVAVGIALLLVHASTWLLAEDYEDMNKIETQISNLVDPPDVAVAKLKDAEGVDILTAGMDPVDGEKQIKRRNIWYVKIAKGGGGAGRVNILVVGNQHAREWVAYRCVLDAAASTQLDSWILGFLVLGTPCVIN